MKLAKSMSFFSGMAFVAISFIACLPASTYSQDAEKAKPKAETGKQPVRIEPLTKGQQDHLLKNRLDGGMGNSFRQF